MKGSRELWESCRVSVTRCKVLALQPADAFVLAIDLGSQSSSQFAKCGKFQLWDVMRDRIQGIYDNCFSIYRLLLPL